MTPRRAFTLIELLVVVLLISILAALLLPAIQAARGSAVRSDCQNRLRQVGVALLLHHDACEEFPAGNLVMEEGICRAWGLAGRDYPSKDGANWAIYLLPYLVRDDLAAKYYWGTFNEAIVNAPVLQAHIAVYACPADVEPALLSVPATGPACPAALNIEYMPGSYRGVSGTSEGIYFLDSSESGSYKPQRRGALHAVGFREFEPESLRTITDGSSHTLIVGESVTRTRLAYRTFWAYAYAQYSLSAVTEQPRTLSGDLEACINAGGYGGSWPCERGWGSFHDGVINFASCDGSVRAIATDVDLKALSALATISGAD
jgi:prepilin-type N-terminal cleavage/methylation domain-containing protein